MNIIDKYGYTDILTGSQLAYNTSSNIKHVIIDSINRNESSLDYFLRTKGEDNKYIMEVIDAAEGINKGLKNIKMMMNEILENTKNMMLRSKTAMYIDNEAEITNARLDIMKEFRQKLYIVINDYVIGISNKDRLEQKLRNITLKFVNDNFKLYDCLLTQYETLLRIYL